MGNLKGEKQRFFSVCAGSQAKIEWLPLGFFTGCKLHEYDKSEL